MQANGYQLVRYQTDPIFYPMTYLFRMFLFCFPVMAVGQEAVVNPSLSAQKELVVVFKSHMDYYYPSYRFSDKFAVPDFPVAFELGSTALYEEKKVKTIRVFDKSYNDTVCWMAELDREGNLRKRGQRTGSNYFRTEEFTKTDTSAIIAVNYFDKLQVIRRDSIFLRYITYQQNDTVIHFTRSRKRSYKSGSVLNEQNTYYNEHYMGLTRMSHSIVWNPEAEAFFTDSLKTDYEDSVLYLSLIETVDSGLEGFADSGTTYLSSEELDHDPLRRDYGSFNDSFYLTEGENVEEPVTLLERWTCSISANYPVSSFEGYTQNEKGLHSTYYYSSMADPGKVIYAFEYDYFD